MDSPKQIIQSLRDYFDLCGLTQEDAAEKTGVSRANISVFLSPTNVHKITDKSATRLCAYFPFNFDYLVSGEGSLLIADTPDSDFPDRANWSAYDYMVAIRRVEYEIKCHETEMHLSNILGELFVDKKTSDGLQICEESIRNILSLPEIQEPDWRACPALPERESSKEQLDARLNNLLKTRSLLRFPLQKEIFFLQKCLSEVVLNYFRRICE